MARRIRQRLDGQWGIVDVDDCVNAARYLVERDEVDGNRVAITGGSAGGYTTLAALTFRDIFKIVRHAGWTRVLANNQDQWVIHIKYRRFSSVSSLPSNIFSPSHSTKETCSHAQLSRYTFFAQRGAIISVSGLK
jgi:hypothetical protein